MNANPETSPRGPLIAPARPAYLANIQVLRFIAAVMVLYAHLLHETALRGLPAQAAVHDPTGLTWRSGVDVFFIVSGFIIYYVSHDRFGAWRNAADFMRRRLLRVAPLYWLFSALMLVALGLFHDRIIHADLNPQTLLGSLLFFPVTRADGDTYPILAVGWSLEYEIFFYACFALSMLAPRRVGLTGLLAGFIGLSLAWHVVDNSETALKYYSDPIIVEFLMGILLARIHLAGVKLSRWVQGGCVVAALGLMAVLGSQQQLDRWIWAGLPAFILTLGFVLGPQIESRWLAEAGGASYSLYLSHPFVLRLLALIWARAELPAGGWPYVAAGLVLCVAVSLVVYRLIEAPLLCALPRHLDAPQPQATAARDVR